MLTEAWGGVGDISDHDLLNRIAGLAAGQASAENFPVALRLLPSGPRRDLALVYRYARFVDDVGDGDFAAPGVERIALLEAVAADVRRLPTVESQLPVISALAPLVADGRLELGPLLDLIEANIVDQRITRYETFGDLLTYCSLSAAPVGRMVLGIARAGTSERIAASDDVCTALQVLEHCQDVGEDARAGRIYLPAAELRAAGVGDARLTGSVTSPALRGVVATQVRRSQEMLEPGRSLVGGLHGWARIAVAGFVAGGLATARALDAADHAVLEQLVKPGKFATARIAVRLAAARPAGRPALSGR